MTFLFGLLGLYCAYSLFFKKPDYISSAECEEVEDDFSF
jgi:hypothetical protein